MHDSRHHLDEIDLVAISVMALLLGTAGTLAMISLIQLTFGVTTLSATSFMISLSCYAAFRATRSTGILLISLMTACLAFMTAFQGIA